MERTIKLDEASYGYLIQILQERYYSTVDVHLQTWELILEKQ